jgi:hypothetical protein
MLQDSPDLERIPEHGIFPGAGERGSPMMIASLLTIVAVPNNDSWMPCIYLTFCLPFPRGIVAAKHHGATLDAIGANRDAG